MQRWRTRSGPPQKRYWNGERDRNTRDEPNPFRGSSSFMLSLYKSHHWYLPICKHHLKTWLGGDELTEPRWRFCHIWVDVSIGCFDIWCLMMLSTYLYGFFPGDFPRCQRFHSFEKRQPLPRPPRRRIQDLPLYLGVRDIEAAELQTQVAASKWHPLKEGIPDWSAETALIGQLKHAETFSRKHWQLFDFTDRSEFDMFDRPLNVSDTVQETKFSSLVTMFRFGCRLAALSRSVHLTLFRLSRLLKLRSYILCWAKDRHSWSYLRLGLKKHISVY